MAGLRDLARQMNKALGDALIATSDDDIEEDVPYWIPTGSLVLDFFLAGGLRGKMGGWAGNRIVELFAEPNLGKSTLAYHAMAEAQKLGGIAGLADTERVHTSQRARSFGVSTDLDTNFMYGRPDNIGEAWMFFEMACASGVIPPKSIFVFDSLSSTEEGYVLSAKDRAKQAKEATQGPAEGEDAAEPAEGEEADGKPATRAQKSANKKGGVARRPQQVREGLRKLAPALARSGVTLLVINHSVLGFVGQFQAIQESGGGDAFKFWASQSVRLIRAGKWTVGNEERGKLLRPIMAKTRVAPPPSSRYKYPIPMTPFGVSRPHELYEFLRENKIQFDGNPVVEPAARHKINNFGLGMFDYDGKEAESGCLSFYLRELDDICAERPDILDYLAQMAFHLGELPG